MERINTLIDKLYQQKTQGAPPAHLLFTVQLLQQELAQLQNRNGSPNSKKVSVTLPVNLNFSEESLRIPFTESGKEKEILVLNDVAEDAAGEKPETVSPQVPIPSVYMPQTPAVSELFYERSPVAVQEEPAPAFVQSTYFNTAFETAADTPTLPFVERRELHHVIAEKKESLNDRLKEEKTEVAHLLKETPIKDLRKAVGINDRFAYVRELFRGDEATYERSIKTINGFNIYSEADYWMSRELKHKLGWDDKNETVQKFYGLVRRRFS